MTTTTIEYEEVVTQEEQVDVCDECSREVDDNGLLYTPAGRGQVSDDQSDLHLHFCSECLREMYEKDVQSASVERTKEWLSERDGAGWTLSGNIIAANKWCILAVLGSACSLMAFIATTASGLAGVAGLISTVWLIVSLVLIAIIWWLVDDAHNIVESVK